MFVVIIFFIFYLYAAFLEIKGGRNRNGLLVFSCVVFALIAGLRDVYYWPDTMVYVLSFKEHTPNIFQVSFSDQPFGYSEFGFYLLQSIVKTFFNSYTIFFLVVSALSFRYLYKNLKEYSVFPLIGLCAYIARFYMGRNFMQIRAGLAYAIILISIKYIYEKDWKRYFLILFIAWLFHRSAIIGIPLYFICNWMKVKKNHIIIALIISFIIGIFGQGFVHMIVEDNASDLNVGDRYIDAGGEKRQVEGLGMRNPMIYFQCFLLLSYTFLEKRLAPLNKYYYVIRNAYLYSTMILICFCTYRVLSARSSSIYATLEIAIIPSLIFLFSKKNRQLAIFIAGVILTTIFYMYQNK